MTLQVCYGKEFIENLVSRYVNGEFCIYDITRSHGSIPDISNYLEMLGVKRSNSEERRTSRYKNKYLKSIRNRYGEDITNISQATVVKAKKAESVARTYGSYVRYREQQLNKLREGYARKISDPAYREILSQRMTGKKNPACRDDVRSKLSLSRKEKALLMSKDERAMMVAKARSVRVKRFGASKAEDYVEDSLKELGVPYIRSVRVGHMQYDFELPWLKAYIEINGTYFHAEPGVFGKRKVISHTSDERKTTAYDVWCRDCKKAILATERGYAVIPIWECDVKRNHKDGTLTEYVNGVINELVELYAGAI